MCLPATRQPRRGGTRPTPSRGARWPPNALTRTRPSLTPPSDDPLAIADLHVTYGRGAIVVHHHAVQVTAAQCRACCENDGQCSEDRAKRPGDRMARSNRGGTLTPDGHEEAHCFRKEANRLSRRTAIASAMGARTCIASCRQASPHRYLLFAAFRSGHYKLAKGRPSPSSRHRHVNSRP